VTVTLAAPLPARARVQRFGLVSLVTAGLGQLSILLLHVGLGVEPVLSNLLATVLVSVVGYVLCTRHVWSSDRTRRYTLEMPGFVLASLLGLVLSSVTVALVAETSSHPLAPNIASAAGFGLAWVLRFAVLDRILFAPRDLGLTRELET
jgi:putative flippase GtrA